MTTRSQKRKAAEELISTEIETSLPENTPSVNPVAGTSKSPKITSDNLEEIKSSLRKEIMSDLTKILAENQKEMLKLIAPTTKKQHAIRSAEESDSDPDDIPENATSTPIRNKTTATASKTTPINSRNIRFVSGILLRTCSNLRYVSFPSVAFMVYLNSSNITIQMPQKWILGIHMPQKGSC